MKLLPIILLLFISCQLFAQGDIDNQDKTFWRNERAFGAAVYSNAWSLDYFEYRQTKPSTRLFIETQFGGYKNPKEVKIQNYDYYSPYSFVFGKINCNWHINAGFGYQHEIFEKRDLGGISIGWFVAGGPVITFCKPIYYKIIKGTSGSGSVLYDNKKFDITTMLPSDIYGKSSFFKGFDEITIYPGIYTHGGFNFEYSKKDKVTHTIEIGTYITGYMKKIPIMANDPSEPNVNNSQFFFSLYVSYKVGVILEPLKMKNDFFYNLFNPKKDKS